MRNKRSMARNQIPALRISRKILEIVNDIKFLFIDKFNRVYKAKKYSSLNTINLNLGCATLIKMGFINIDFMKFGELRLDLRKPLPFKDNSVDYIYSSHFFQYIEFIDSTAIRCLSDYYRILKKGGKMRMIIPDHEKLLKAYANNDIKYYINFIRIDNKLPHHLNYSSIIDYVNYAFQYGKVRYAYDFEKMEILLKSIGFKNIIKDKINPKVEREARKSYSLYINSEK